MAFLQLYSDNDMVYHHSLDEAMTDADRAGTAYDWHTHGATQCEILYVIRGSGRYYAEGGEYPAQPGSIFIARAGERHRIRLDPGVTYERMVFIFKIEQIQALDPSGVLLKPFYDRPAGERNHYTDAVLGPMPQVIQNQPKAAAPQEVRIFAVGQTLALLCAIYAAFVAAGGEDQTQKRKRKVIQPALEYIHAHLFEPLTMEAITRHAFISSSQLSKVFREQMGTSVYGYILIKRLAAARFQIHAGVPARQAAEECGFPTYSSFYKAYLKQYGESPTGIRRKA
ncbi:MAG: AraC family transcriptional regulator [Acutalibacteraceae bacterium]|jgi:AraC-like DNA-binding protein